MSASCWPGSSRFGPVVTLALDIGDDDDGDLGVAGGVGGLVEVAPVS